MNRREALKRTAGLTGFAVTTTAGMGFLSGCEPTGDPDWEPKFLTSDEVNHVSAIVDMILPKTDTPGALELHVPEFIDLMLKDNYPEEDQIRFREGLSAFNKYVSEDYDKEYDKCSNEEKNSIIKNQTDRSVQIQKSTGKKDFYLIIKELTLLGYFSSEYVMTNMLNYHPVATRYEGCIPLNEGDKLYVDNNV